MDCLCHTYARLFHGAAGQVVTADPTGSRLSLLRALQPETGSEAGALQLQGERAAALFLPSATANWRLNLMRSGGLPDSEIAKLRFAHLSRLPVDNVPCRAWG